MDPKQMPLALRIPWYGTHDEDHAKQSFAYLQMTAAQMFARARAYPCALQLHAVDAYELAAHPLFAASHGFGQVLGRILSMAVMLDPEGIAGQADLMICTGCRSRYPSCDYVKAAV